MGFTLAVSLSCQAQDDNSAPPPPPDNSDQGQGAQGQGPYAQQPADQSPGQPTGPIDSTGATGPADNAVSFQTFYDALGGYGNWIQTSQYGYVWQPNINDPNWAPYTDGNWVYTNAGWTWNSNEPWGWATYHYGRWVNLDGTGWVWVPGYTWGPAWVSWRYGDGYVGWAPLPPDSAVGIDYYSDDSDADYDFHIGGDADEYYGIGPALYIFLPIGCVCYHDYHHWYHNRNENWGLINHTTNVTNINVGRGGAARGAATFTHVTAGGPEVAQIDAASESPVPRATLSHASRPGAGTINGGSLAVYAPHVSTGGANARPAQVAGTVATPTINRGTDIERPLAVNSRLAPSAPSETQIAAAHEAINNAPENAKVLTDASSVKPVFQGTLTTLKPAAAPVVAQQQQQQPRGYTFAPGRVYNNNPGGNSVYGPVHTPSAVPSEGETPSEREAREAQQQQRVYSPSPTPNYIPHYAPPAGGNESQGESHTYTHVTPAPTYTPAPAEPSREPAREPSYTPPEPSRAPEPSSSSSSSGGGRESSGSSSPSPSYQPSGGGSSGGSSGSSRSH
jgi:uncharacterized membrane protein YgcG